MENSCWLYKAVVVISLFCLSVQGKTLAGIDGQWQTACQKQGGDFSILNLQIGGRAWVYTTRSYDDTACKIPYLQYDEIRDVSVLNGTDVDVKTLSLYFTPMSEGAVRILKQARFCGRTDWQLNVRTEVDGKSCLNMSLPIKGQIHYSRYRYTGLELWLGVPSGGHDGLKPENRHLQFQEFPYERMAE